MTIADLSTVWVTSQVPETYIRFVQVGERVEINLVAYPGETFDGRVSRIADTVDPQTRTVKVQAEMGNPQGRFRPEMFGSIHHIESTAMMTVIPFGAVVQDGNRTVVFVERAPGAFRGARRHHRETGGNVRPGPERRQAGRLDRRRRRDAARGPRQADLIRHDCHAASPGAAPALSVDRDGPRARRPRPLGVQSAEHRSVSGHLRHAGGRHHALPGPRGRRNRAAGLGADRAGAQQRAERDRAALADDLWPVGRGAHVRVRHRTTTSRARWCSKNCATPRCRTA